MVFLSSHLVCSFTNRKFVQRRRKEKVIVMGQIRLVTYYINMWEDDRREAPWLWIPELCGEKKVQSVKLMTNLK